jgi:hypothetical protein
MSDIEIRQAGTDFCVRLSRDDLDRLQSPVLNEMRDAKPGEEAELPADTFQSQREMAAFFQWELGKWCIWTHPIDETRLRRYLHLLDFLNMPLVRARAWLQVAVDRRLFGLNKKLYLEFGEKYQSEPLLRRAALLYRHTTDGVQQLTTLQRGLLAPYWLEQLIETEERYRVLRSQLEQDLEHMKESLEEARIKVAGAEEEDTMSDDDEELDPGDYRLNAVEMFQLVSSTFHSLKFTAEELDHDHYPEKQPVRYHAR